MVDWEALHSPRLFLNKNVKETVERTVNDEPHMLTFKANPWLQPEHGVRLGHLPDCRMFTSHP